MSATLSVADKATTRRNTRDEIARRVVPLLGETPQSAVMLADRMGLTLKSGAPDNRLVLDALNVAFARRQARRIPNTAGSVAGGWVAYNAKITVEQPAVEFRWPFKRIEWVRVSKMGIDETFQRPLTTFASQIESDFDFELFGVLLLSDRGAAFEAEHGWRFSLIDGQTRWVALSNLGATEAPAIVYTGLAPEGEAGIFWRLQKFRKNAASSDTFRARLREGDPLALAVSQLTKESGYGIGTGPGEIRSPKALEDCYKSDPIELENTLADFKEAWPKVVPAAKYIKGLHFFLRNYPIGRDEFWDVDHVKLVKKLKLNGPRDIDKMLLSVSDLHTGSDIKLMGLAFEAVYNR